MRYTWYDDNTPATALADGITNNPSAVWLPGIFMQDEIALSIQSKILLGIRYDHNSIHGNIFTPRLNYKWISKNKKDVLRFSPDEPCTGSVFRQCTMVAFAMEMVCSVSHSDTGDRAR